MRIIPGAIAIFVSAAAITACAQRTPTAPDTATLTLRPGQEVSLLGSVTYALLVEVASDSRCPGDVLCVTAGNAAAVVGIRVGSGPTIPYTLNTTTEPRTVSTSGYELRLDSLNPYPRTTLTTNQSDYVAYVSVTRANGGAP
ncbi:MAG: hypothetical protein O2973_13650 [Gemmatimonadetes bacterium]|nr:hypothetical protein [Gemmatimonadota bacterium]